MRGKYGARATLRREDADVRSEIGTYQHHVKRLTDENAKLKADLAAERAAHKREVRRLKAQLDEGLSPELLALRQELERQRDRADAAGAREAEKVRKWQRMFDFTANILHDVTGCTGLEAIEAILDALGAGVAQIIGQHAGADLSATPGNEGAAAALQRSRGFRSPQKVIDHLNALCHAATRPPDAGRDARRLGPPSARTRVPR